MDRYDSIVIGAGHNGLVCAAYLAQGGQRVLVLEATDVPGGLGRSHEFHPGFHASVAHSVSHFSQKVATDLKLASFGFETASKPMQTVGLSVDEKHVVVHEDSVSGTSTDDSESYQKYSRLMHRFANVLKPFWLKTIPRLGNNSLTEMMTFAHLGLNIRRIGKSDMREFLRIASLPARDLMDEYFESELLKATLSWDGLIGSRLAPRSPNSAVLALLYRMTGVSKGAHSIPANGVSGLIESLCTSATASGAEIRIATEVRRILVDRSTNGLIAKGVELVDGEKIEATRIISATDPQRTFFDLVGVENLDIGFTNRIRRLRCDGYVAKLHLALSGLPEFNGIERPDGRMIIAPDMDTIEFSFDDAKYGDCPANPVMEIVLPSVHDASVAPAGQHVLSAHVMYVPYRLKGGWNDAAAELICERVIDGIAQYAPRIREQIVHREFLTPADLEQNYRVTGGHWHHTEFAMDQMFMMRPTYEAAQYGTPIPGLFLCGAGCHPGGDIMGGPGHNAALEILR
ncbi:MAG: NAD(P)/FAD-dependent oxidoreductase [Gammaproteobacteria bacterium]|nr:NAD(P)/FAD-dependent oxidoreductase [Gammaproteobacteria bacterium]